MRREKRVLHIWSCGHRRRYPNALRDRTVRHEELCHACVQAQAALQQRFESQVELLLDRAHALFGNMGRCIRQSVERI